MATSSQDGAAGAGTHAQTEAVGLGPPTVVRLESTLAHEVLRYCTAIRGSVLKVVRGTGCDESTGATGQYLPTAFEALIGHNRKPAATKYSSENTGMRKGPSTQAWSNVREPAAHGQTRAVCPVTVPPNRRKTAYGGPAGHPCQATRRLTVDGVNMNTTILTLVRLPVRAERS